MMTSTRYRLGSRGSGLQDERKHIPRAFWWGVEWVTHTLTHFWRLEGMEEPRMVRGYNSKKIFDDQLHILPKDLKRRMKYFRPFLRTKKIHLYAVYSGTDRDGQRYSLCLMLHIGFTITLDVTR
jgi:hypothetical protein